MKLSLVIPMYNTPMHSLERCLESVARELAYRDAECIIIDDGSTDGSGSLCKVYRDRYPQLFKYVHQVNKGNAVSRNNGVKYSQGKWIAFLDSDDFLAPGYFTYVDMAIKQWGKEHPVLHFNHYRCKITDEDILTHSYIPQDRMCFKAKEVHYDKSNRSHTLMWTYLIKRDFIIKNNIFLPEDKGTVVSNKARIYVGQDNYYKILLFNYAPKNCVFDMCWFGVCHYIREDSIGSVRKEAPSTWKKDVIEELTKRKELHLESLKPKK